MKFFSFILPGLAAATLLAASPAHADNDQTIVDIAVGSSDFSSLVDAVVSQDLAETLSSEGPFTVFAPTNDAFAKLPRVISYALEQEPSLLTDILLTHVVAGDVRAADVVGIDAAPTVGGEVLPVRVVGGNVFIGPSKVTATDIVARNGVIHVIDRVIIPREIFSYARQLRRADKMGM